jgi:PII-like signaling protein
MTKSSKLLVCVVGENRLHGEIPLYEFIVRRLRQLGLAGATAIRGELGFGHHEAADPTSHFEISADRPVVVFAVDAAERIERVLPEVRAQLAEGLVAVVDAELVAQTGLRASTTE